MFSFVTGRDRPQGHPLLDELCGQSIIHTRVAARGTWTITARGWALHSRIQLLDHPDRRGTAGHAAVGLRDPRLLGASITHAALHPRGRLHLTATAAGASAPLGLSTLAPWRLQGPRGVQLACDEKGELSATPPGPPRFATAESLAEHAASRASTIEHRLLQIARRAWLHPGHVVEALAATGALRDEEFEQRGTLLLARMLARGELRAGFVTEGRFTAWTLSTAEVVEHIGTTWAAIGGRAPGRDMIAWFELTDIGRDHMAPTGPHTLPPGMSGYDSPGVVGGFR